MLIRANERDVLPNQRAVSANQRVVSLMESRGNHISLTPDLRGFVDKQDPEDIELVSESCNRGLFLA